MWGHAVGSVAFVPTPTLWVAIYTTPPGADDLGLELPFSGAVMPDGTISNYGRPSQPNDLTSWGPLIAGQSSNVSTILLPSQNGTMGPVTAVGWRDDPLAGNLYFSMLLGQSIILNVGDNILFAPGVFSILWQDL
jgi:hypothetical protein